MDGGQHISLSPIETAKILGPELELTKSTTVATTHHVRPTQPEPQDPAWHRPLASLEPDSEEERRILASNEAYSDYWCVERETREAGTGLCGTVMTVVMSRLRSLKTWTLEMLWGRDAYL